MLRAGVLRLCSVSELASCVSGNSVQASIRGTPLACVLIGHNLQFCQRYSTEGGDELREVTDPRVLQLAEQIMQLNLLEVSDLTEVLRKRLNIQPGFSTGMLLASGAPQGAAVIADDAAPPAAAVEAKTEFVVKLEGFDSAAKIKVIKEVRAITDLGLKEAKELVENSPVVLKTGIKKEEAEQMKAKLESAGAKVALE